jgi:MscS family membrane protein
MTALNAFWEQVVAVWQMSIMGARVDRVVIAALVLVVFILLRRVVAQVIVGSLKRLAKRTKTQMDDLVLDALEQPLTFVPIAFGVFLAARMLGLDGTAATAATKLNQTLIAMTIFWGLYRLVDPFGYMLRPLERVFTNTLIEWVRKALKGFFVFVGAVAVLTIWGIPVMPVLASLSLISVAVALGAQDFFKNLIGGLLIIAERRFKPGDWILVDGVVEGTVQTINFRSTSVRRFDKALVNVPNAQLSDSAVTNFSEMTHRRIYWKIGVEYRTSADQLRQIRDGIEAYILGSDEFAHPPEVSTFVRIDAFNESSIDIMIYCFTRTTDWGEWLEIKERFAYKITEIVEAAGTGFAFPSRSIYIETPCVGTPGADTLPQTPDAMAAPATPAP